MLVTGARPLSDRQLAIAARLCFLLAALVLIFTAALEGRACAADTLDVMVVTSAAADLGTTEWALRGSPSLHEVNPLMQTPGGRVGVKALATVGVIGGARYLEHRGHPKAAKLLRIAAIVAWSGLAVNNAVKARGVR